MKKDKHINTKIVISSIILCLIISSCGIIIKGANGMKQFKHKKFKETSNKSFCKS